MLPSEFIDELPELEPLPIELPDDEEPLPIELPEPVDDPEPVPIVLPEPLVEPLDDGLVVPKPLVPEPLVPLVPVPLVPEPVLLVPVLLVPVLLDGEVVVLLPEGVVVVLLLPDGVVVVLELELDWAMATPPMASNDAAAMAVVVFKNEPMVITPVWLKRRPTGLLRFSRAR